MVLHRTICILYVYCVYVDNDFVSSLSLYFFFINIHHTESQSTCKWYSLSILSILSPCIFIYTEKDPLIINSPYISLITSLHHIISLLEPGRFCWIIHKYPIKSWISYKITMFLGKNGRFGRTFTPGSCSSSAWPRRKIYGPVPAVMGGVMGQPSGKLTKKTEKPTTLW